MHEFVNLDGMLLKPTEALIPAISSAALLGKGVFTTLAVYEGKPFLWSKHWRRLAKDSERVGIDISVISEERVLRSLEQILESNEVANGRARITFFDASSTALWPFDSDQITSILIITGERRSVPDHIRLTTSQFRLNTRSPVSGLKSCSYLENLLALDEARANGFDEAVRINERGEIAGACMANIFWLNGDRLYTPALLTGCLAGTTREFILEDLQCDEVVAGIQDLRGADDLFLASAGLGVIQVAEFEGREMQRRHHRILDLMPQ